MSTYTPSPAHITGFTAVTDGSTEDAALFAPFLEGLANQGAWVADGGDLSALSWINGGATTNTLKRLAYSKLDGVWIGVGDGGNNFVESSVSFGRAWTNIGGTIAGSVGAKTYLEAAFSSASGYVVIAVNGSRDVVVGTRTAWNTFTWAATANALSILASAIDLDFEPTSALWIALYRTGASGMRLDTSSNGTAWTARALPATWSGYTGSNNPRLGAAAGHAVGVLATVEATATIETIYSSNGTTWTGVTLTSTIAPADISGPWITRPAYDTGLGVWWFAVSSSTADSAEVWKSADNGATWSVAKSFASLDVRIEAACMIGGVWACLTTKGRLMVSKDAGASWSWVLAHDGTANVFTMRGGGDCAIVINWTDKTSFRSLRAARVAGTGV